jgi:thiamine transporter
MKQDRVVLRLTFIALYSALFIVLDYAAHTFGMFQMPNGGSLGLGTLAILVAAYHLGWKEGVVVGLISIPLQILSSGTLWFTPTWPLIGLLLDYVVPFGVYGLTPLIKDFKVWKVKIPVGIIAVNLIRAFSHTLAGAYLWVESAAGSLGAWSFSATYNLTYMIPTMILGAILVPMIVSRLPKKYLKA